MIDNVNNSAQLIGFQDIILLPSKGGTGNKLKNAIHELTIIRYKRNIFRY